MTTLALPDPQALFDAIAPLDRYGKLLSLPKVGDGATYGVGSDSYAGTVIRIDPYGKTVVVTIQDDSARWNKETGQHDYSPSVHGRTNTFRLEKYTYNFSGFEDGDVWIEEKRTAYKWWQVYLNDQETHYVKAKCPSGVGFGHRRYYQDPSF